MDSDIPQENATWYDYFNFQLKKTKQKDDTQATEGKQGDNNYVAYAVFRCCFLYIYSHMNQPHLYELMLKL